MSKPETLMIDDVAYVRKDSVNPNIISNVKIVVLQRGWAMVGEFTRNCSDCTLKSASVLRKWGTTGGLGQIAKDGPTSGTKLDKTNGVVSFDYLAVVCTIDCEASKWKNVL